MATISTDYLCENGFLVKRKRKKKERKRKRREEIRFTSRRKGDDAPCIERGYYLRRP